MNVPRILIIQRILPHYRLPLFLEFCRSKHFNATIAYGAAPKCSSLQSIGNPNRLTFLHVKNKYLDKEGKFVYQTGVLSAILSGQFEVVIAEFDIHIISNLLAFFWAKTNNIKFIWWGHGIGPKYNLISKYLRLLLSRFVDAMIFYDSERANQFISWGIPKSKVFVAWNSIDTKEVDSFRKEWSSTCRYRILSICRLIPEKKVDLLVRGFAQAQSYIRGDIRLTIIGDGPERRKIENLVKDLNIHKCVDLVGEVYEQVQLASYFNTSLISVSPGYIGLNAIHSFAYGVPMLIADAEPHGPEIAAVKDGENALFFSSGNVDDLAQKLIKLTNEAGLLPQMSVDARRTVEKRFSTSAMVKKFERAVAYTKG